MITHAPKRQRRHLGKNRLAHFAIPVTRKPPIPSSHRVRVGTASWTDPGFIADWYPPKLPARERLAWYAEHFDLVEVNSSFYAVPAQPQVAKWAEQTPSD